MVPEVEQRLVYIFRQTLLKIGKKRHDPIGVKHVVAFSTGIIYLHLHYKSELAQRNTFGQVSVWQSAAKSCCVTLQIRSKLLQCWVDDPTSLVRW